MLRIATKLVLLGVTSAQPESQQSAVSIKDMLMDPRNTMAPPPTPLHQNSYASPAATPIPLPGASDPHPLGTLLAMGANSLNPKVQPQISSDFPANSGAVGGSQKESIESREIVAGLVEAFMHKQRLLPGERTCLENSVSQLTADVVGTCKDIVDAVKSLLPGQPAQPAQPGAYPPSVPQSKPRGNLVSTGIDGVMKITSLVTLSSTLVKNCVQGDALVMLNETAHHLIDMKYLGHRLLVSGVDIAHFLSDAIVSFERHQYKRFGMDIGASIRKVLLSNATRGSRLPEGVPEESIIQEATEGIMDGFFQGGSKMEVTDLARPDVDIKLDLHACIAGNQLFFKEIFLALWNAIAQFSMNAQQPGGFKNAFFNATAGGSGTPQWTGQLMIALMQLPAALQRCNVDDDTQSMMLEAIQTLPQLQVHVEFPSNRKFQSDKTKGEEISVRMAKAVEAWTNWNFEKFGDELGIMLREFVLLAFPEKYSVDDNGRLRRQLSSSLIRPGRQQLASGSLACTAGGLGVLSLVGLVAVRGIRSAHAHGAIVEAADVEQASNDFLSEELVE